jgi:hypothetical protein
MANFDEDLDIFFELDEFAVEVECNATTFNAIFDKPTMNTESFDASIEAEHSRIQCKTADLTTANAKRKDAITVDGNNYTIAQIRQEGQGTSIVWLKSV